MSQNPTPFDPYLSPAVPDAPYAPMSNSPRRPGWLTALCVVAIVIGVLGAMNGLFGIVGVLAGPSLQAAFTPKVQAGPGVANEIEKIQQQFQAEMNQVQNKYFVGLLTASLLRVVVAAGLLVGGVMSLNLKPNGRTILLLACGAGILYEVGISVILQSLINMEMSASMNAFFESIVETLPKAQGGGPPPEMFLNIMKASIVFGFAIQYVFAAIKIVFYLWGLIYLQREAIRALFDSAPGPGFAKFA
jgi:hypothetical protein